MILLKKAVRSIWRGKRAYIACVALMALGIMVYVSFNVMYINLTAAEDSFYETQRFGDVFAQVRGIPATALAQLEEIPGVKRASARLTASSRADMPDRPDEIITLRLLSHDPLEPEPLNAFLLSDGAEPQEGEILLGEVFAQANGIAPGDTLALTVSGRRAEFAVSGTAKSPDYVYAMPEDGSLMPDNKTFGFGYVPYSRLAALTGETGRYNSVSFLLEDGVKFTAVEPLLEDELTPYGLESLSDRDDHPSAEMLDQELTSIGGMSTSMPMVFIFMAVIILYLMLKRVIEQERGQIGTLKAFGYSDASVLLHYMCYGLFAGGLGGALGCVAGFFTANAFTAVYAEFFNLPALDTGYDIRYFIYGMAIALGAGGLGSFMGTRGVVKLNPSDAMRPPAPPVTKSDVLSKLKFLRAILASNGYMAVRNITRNPLRSLFVIMGISFSFAMIGFTSSFTFYMDRMLLQQFQKVELYDVKASLKSPVGASHAVEAAYGVAGVSLAEPILELPCEIKLENRSENIAITGLKRQSILRRIYDADYDIYFSPPTGGLLVSGSLARRLGAKRGDILTIKTPYTGDGEYRAAVTGLVNESLGMAAYMELGSLCELLGTPESANAVAISGDASAVKAALRDADNVTAVTSTQEALQVYEEMMQTYSSLFYMMQLAGVGVALAIITNTATISLSERKREYATMRVLGMQPREIARIVGFEYWVLAFVGVWPGIPLLRGINTALLNLMDTTLFTLPTTPPGYVYVISAALCFVAVAVCNLLCARRISKFDMVEVLKERE